MSRHRQHKKQRPPRAQGDRHSAFAESVLDRSDRLVVELLVRADAARDSRRGRTSAKQLMRALFAELELDAGEQKRVRDRFHAVIAGERLIERALAAATPNGVAPAVAPALRVLAARVLAGELAPNDAARKVAWVDWQRVRSTADLARATGDPLERLQLVGSIPAWLAQRLLDGFGDDALALVEASIARPPVVLRCNALRGSRDELIARLSQEGVTARAGRFAPHAVEVTAPAQLFRTAAFHDGWFEMQDEASQLVAEITAPPPGGTVLDACAGAGGKTLALAALLANRGEILATDSDAARLVDLRRRARRAGVHDVQALRVPAERWPDEVAAFAARADRILVDAPCTGSGSLRRNPDVRWRSSEGELPRLMRIQRELCERALAALRPRARLVYATCSVLREENQDLVEALCAAHPELERVPVVEILGGERGRPIADPSGTFLQTLPHRHGTDGFFAAVLRRR